MKLQTKFSIDCTDVQKVFSQGLFDVYKDSKNNYYFVYIDSVYAVMHNVEVAEFINKENE